MKPLGLNSFSVENISNWWLQTNMILLLILLNIACHKLQAVLCYSADLSDFDTNAGPIYLTFITKENLLGNNLPGWKPNKFVNLI